MRSTLALLLLLRACYILPGAAYGLPFFMFQPPWSAPKFSPSSHPSLRPSSHPTISPSSSPSNDPSYRPSSKPTSSPSFSPSHQPSSRPSSQPTSSPSFSPSYSSQQSLPVQRPSQQNSNEPPSLRTSPNNLVSAGEMPPPSAFGFLLTVGVMALIIYFIVTHKNVNCLKRRKKGGREDFLNNLGEVIDNHLVTYVVEIDEEDSTNQIITIDEETNSVIDLKPESDDDHRRSGGRRSNSNTRTHRYKEREPSPTQNIHDDDSGCSDQSSTTSSHESEAEKAETSWLGKFYHSMSVSVDEGVDNLNKFVRGKRRSDDGGSKRRRGRGADRSENKPSPPSKAHSSKRQRSDSKRRQYETDRHKKREPSPPKDWRRYVSDLQPCTSSDGESEDSFSAGQPSSDSDSYKEPGYSPRFDLDLQASIDTWTSLDP